MKYDWIECSYKDTVLKISTTKQKLKQKEYLQNGEIPVIDQGQDIIGGYTNDKQNQLTCTLPVIIFGDHTKNVKLINFPFAPGADGTKVLQPLKYIDPKYLYYITKILVLKIKDNGYARHYQHIEKEKIPLAPLTIQHAIVRKIESLFSSLDSGIADLKKAQDQLKIYRQAVLKKAFEGELTKEWREAARKKRMENFAWQVVKLNDVAVLNPRPNKSEIDDNLEIQFLPMKLVEEVSNKIHLTETRRFKEVQKKSYTYFEEEDILFAKVTPCMENGKIAIARKLTNGLGYGSSEFHVIRTTEKIVNDFLFYFLVQEKFRSDAQHAMTGAVGLRRVPKQFLEEHEIKLPSSEEQHQIVQEIESRLSICDAIEQSIKESLEKAQALRQSILKKAFKGTLLSKEEIAACKAQPDYEPASVLLERIKKEKHI